MFEDTKRQGCKQKTLIEGQTIPCQKARVYTKRVPWCCTDHCGSGLSVYIYIFNKMSLLFHLFFLNLTCSCPYSYNLMLTTNEHESHNKHKNCLFDKFLLEYNYDWIFTPEPQALVARNYPHPVFTFLYTYIFFQYNIFIISSLFLLI
jgi:hypothetical protein